MVSALPIGDEPGKGIGQTQMRRQLGTIVRTAKHPYIGRGIACRIGKHLVPGMAGRQGLPRHPRLQLHDMLRKMFAGIPVRVEQLRSAPVAARGTPHAQVNAARCQGIEHPELFGHFQRGIVRQHDPCAAEPDAVSPCGYRRHQHFGRSAHDAGMAVVLADPKPVIAQTFCMLSQRQCLPNRFVLTPSRNSHRLVENRQTQTRKR